MVDLHGQKKFHLKKLCYNNPLEEKRGGLTSELMSPDFTPETISPSVQNKEGSGGGVADNLNWDLVLTTCQEGGVLRVDRLG